MIKNMDGFTLIEVIATIVIMAVAAAIFVSYMGSTAQSPTSAISVSDQYLLSQKMEELTNQYRQALVAGNGTVANLCTTFKTNYVNTMQINGVSIVDAANTYCTSFTDSTNAYTTTDQNALLVTLIYNRQVLQTVFTK